ncbi:response regulator [Dapis sp. BLCC M126]|uniref:response regulator n=1 Tax=Dapis sp. BLCC M126 TaxID=3400189 RepID=UPI003CF5A9A4
MIKRSFQLVRNFSIVSLTAFSLGITLLSVLYRHQVVSNLLMLTEQNNVMLTQFLANTISQEYGTFLSSTQTFSNEELAAHSKTRQINEIVIEKLEGLSILKVKIYDLQGRTVFSTNFLEIGQDKSKSSGFLLAKSGEVSSQLGHRDTFKALHSNLENRDLLSSYIPMYANGNNKDIIGVFELYTDITPLLQHINQTQKNLSLGSLAILTIVYATLFLFVKKADHLVTIQYQQLQVSEVNSRTQANELKEVLYQLEQAKLKLLNTKERLELATSAAKIGVWDWDILQDQLSWDDHMCEIYGVKSSSLTNKVDLWKQSLHPEDAPQTKELLSQSIQGEKDFHTVFRIIVPDGSIRWIEAHGIVEKNDQDEPQRMVGINIDVSTRKLAEAELQRTNVELAHATKLKNEFLATISHELRTPLNAILGMSEALLDKLHGEINENQKDAIQVIDRNGNHLLQLINDIIDVTRIESGQIKLQPKQTKINDLCENSLVLVRQQTFNKQIQTHLQITPNLPDLIIDKQRIVKVLINLLNNAIKFTPAEGSVTLKVTSKQEASELNSANTESSPNCSQTWIRFSVIDSGIGISQKNIGKLFQSFVQIDSALNRKYSGTGLGLSLVKQIVELHGGKVGVISEEGVGSHFWFDLPCDDLPLGSSTPTLPTDSITPPTQVTSEPPIVPLCILLAEDNLSNIKTISSYLKIKGYKILIANNGEEAINIAKSEHPDLILMDIQMPKLDGLEAMKQIRQDLALKNTPIIALTGLAMDGDREKCLAAGATDYFTKPVRLKQLATIIEKNLSVAELSYKI